jgi:hypothetical protein
MARSRSPLATGLLVWLGVTILAGILESTAPTSEAASIARLVGFVQIAVELGIVLFVFLDEDYALGGLLIAIFLLLRILPIGLEPRLTLPSPPHLSARDEPSAIARLRARESVVGSIVELYENAEATGGQRTYQVICEDMTELAQFQLEQAFLTRSQERQPRACETAFSKAAARGAFGRLPHRVSAFVPRTGQAAEAFVAPRVVLSAKSATAHYVASNGVRLTLAEGGGRPDHPLWRFNSFDGGAFSRAADR